MTTIHICKPESLKRCRPPKFKYIHFDSAQQGIGRVMSVPILWVQKNQRTRTKTPAHFKCCADNDDEDLKSFLHSTNVYWPDSSAQGSKQQGWYDMLVFGQTADDCNDSDGKARHNAGRCQNKTNLYVQVKEILHKVVPVAVRDCG